MLRFGAVFDRNGAETIENGAETIEIGAETIENGRRDCQIARHRRAISLLMHVSAGLGQSLHRLLERATLRID